MTDERGTTAQDLRVLAQDPRYSGRAEDLTSLADALVDEADVSWTGVDLIGAFYPGSTILVAHKHIVERVLGMLAGASVFLPVAWTWLGLRKAVVAYRELISENPEERQTFLALWTTGFDGRLGEGQQLASLALQSFGLIVFAVLCIVLHRMAAEYNVVKEEQQASEAQRRLTIALARAQRLLNQRRSDDVRFIEAAVKRSMTQLNKAHSATRQGIEDLDAAVKNAVGVLSTASTTAVQELNSATQGALSAFAQASTAAYESISPLIEAASQAGAEAATSARAATQASDSLTNASMNLAAGVETSIGRIQTSLAEQHGELVRSTQSAIGDLRAGVSDLSSAQASATQAIQVIGELGEKSNGEVNGLLEALTQTLRDHESALQGQASELARVADYAGRYLGEFRNGSEPNHPVGG